MSDWINASRRDDFVVTEILADPGVGGRQVEVASGDIVYEQGAAADHVYCIQRGQVRVYQVGPDGSGRLLEILGAGQWFGWSALSESRVHGAKAVAVGKTVLTQAPAEGLIDALGRAPRVAVQLVKELASRLQAAREDAARLVFDDCNARLIQTLVRFSRSAAATPHDDGVVLHITHEQLAQAVGVARETVSLALTEMRLKNLVRTGRNQLTFNPETLARFACGGSGRKTESQPVREEVAA